MRPLPLLRQAVLLVLVGQAVAAPTGNFTVGAERSAHKEFDLYRRYTSVNASENAADDPPIPRPTNKPQPKPEKPYVGYDSFHEIPERAPGKLAGVTWADMLVGFLRASPVRLTFH